MLFEIGCKDVNVSVRMVKLFARFLELTHEARKIEKPCSDNNRRAFVTFECCKAHRILKIQDKAIREEAHLLCPVTSVDWSTIGMELSYNWWRHNGFFMPSDSQQIVD